MTYSAEDLIALLEKARELGASSIELEISRVTFESHEEIVQEERPAPFKTRKNNKRPSDKNPITLDCRKPGHEMRPSKWEGHEGEFYCHGCHLERVQKRERQWRRTLAGEGGYQQ